MEFGDTKIPDEMLEAASNEFFKAASLNGLPNCTDGQRLNFALVAAVRWFVHDILHECNVDFHRAILAAEQKRFPGSDQDTAVITRRIDFEYGVSFARRYIRGLFTVRATDPRQLAHRLLHKLWTASVGQETYNKQDWNDFGNLLDCILWPQGEDKNNETP
jgi:hypothetical protein